jgi:hypothetical protein
MPIDTPNHAGAPPLAEFRRLLRLVRVRGARRTVRAVVQGYVFAFRRWYLLYRPIRPGPPPVIDPQFDLRLARTADIESFAVFEPNRHRREFQQWLADGAFVFAAFADGRPVAFQCVSHSVPTGPPLSSLRLAPDQVWTVDVQTLPEFRRHHVANSLRSYRNRVLAERGYRESVASVQEDNLPALSYGYGGRKRIVDRVELLTYLCVLGFRRIWLERDALPRLERRLAEAGLLREDSA